MLAIQKSESHPASRPVMEKPVLLVGNFLSSSVGTRSICEELACRMTDLGWTVFRASCKFSRLARLLDMLRTVWRERNRYVVAQVDVYSGPAFIWAEAICFALQTLGKPYVLILRGGNLPRFAQKWPGRVRRLLRSAVIVTAPSGYLLDRMKPYRAEMILLPNPLDLNSYSFRLRKHPQPSLVWLRAFHAIYNPSLAARVVALLEAEFPDTRLKMVGPDKGDGSLQAMWQMADRLGVAARINAPGSVPKMDVPTWINKGDIFINTTNVDNTPVSVLEAMACGLCVVSTNVGGIPYLLEHEIDALLVPPDDAEAMANAVRRVLTEPALAERLSQNARKKAKQFDWSIVFPQWKELLVAGGEGRRP